MQAWDIVRGLGAFAGPLHPARPVRLLPACQEPGVSVMASMCRHQGLVSVRDLRELAHGIHLPVLSDSGLVAALESRATRYPISVQILADDGLRAERFSEDVEGTAYFVACESLTNVAKHAGTDGARVRLSHSGSRLRLVVEDDGQGFEPNGARSGGLANIRDRVEALHGHLTIESRLGAGTSVRAELPLATSAVGQ